MRAVRTALLALLAAALPLLADQSPNQLKGFNPENVYYAHDIDTINAFNGNLTLTVPIGQEYPVSEGFSYRLTLHGNANIWDSQEVHRPNEPLSSTTAARTVRPNAEELCDPGDDTNNGVTVAHPHRRANAGLGWILTLGRLYTPLDPTRGGSSSWMYESPDGSEHPFRERLHYYDVGETPSNVMYTSDGTYIRMTEEDADTRILEFPDGSIHTFKKSPLPGGRGPWLPVKLEHRGSAGKVDITYPMNTDGSFDWVIDDSHGRQHTVHFAKKLWDGGWKAIVTSVELTSFAGAAPATYQFNYQQKVIGRTEWHEVCPGFNRGATVQLLESVVLPDDSASSYTFKYDESHDNIATAGLPRYVILPTGGVIVWDWKQWTKPQLSSEFQPYFAHSWGVGKRHRKLSHPGDPIATWHYELRFDGNYLFPTSNPPREMKTLVFDPDENVSVSYFSVATHDYQDWKFLEYGRPFTKNKHDGAGKYLSQEQFAPSDQAPPAPPTPRPDPAASKRLRSTYVKYETDDGESNPRVAATRVVYNDDVVLPASPTDVLGGAQWVETVQDDFDGLGHYRETKVSGSSAFGNIEKTTTTDYNPDRGDVPDDHTPQADWSEYSMIPPGDDWIIGTFPSVVITDGTGTSRSEYCYDADGRVQRVRSKRASTGTDLLVVYEDEDDDGNVDREEYYGGDDPAFPAPAAACDSVGTPQYVLEHTFDAGVRRTTKYTGKTFKTLDLDIDASTGLPGTSRDSGGIATQYKYNAVGQLLSVRPAGQAWVQYTYNVDPDSVPHGSVTVRQWPETEESEDPSGTPLTEERYYYDTFGRLIQQRRRMPDAGTTQQWSVSEITYDKSGRKVHSSIAVTLESGDYAPLAAGTKGTVLKYDALGRVRETILPDLSVSTTSYKGARRVSRSAVIATVDDLNQTVWNAEEYDAHGRLVKVIENTNVLGETLSSDTLSTTYQYDQSNRLKQVDSGVQRRTFLYDAAGLLTEEDHPELAPTYYKYDARGHVWSKIVSNTKPASTSDVGNAAVALELSYDAAERLVTVRDGKSEKVLKELTYDTNGNGRLATQTRHNYFSDLTYSVTDTFTYDPVTGRPDTKTTDVKRHELASGEESTQQFTQSYDYTELGAPAHIQFPTCPTCGNVANDSRNLLLGYQKGVLTGIQNVTPSVNGQPTGITYTPAGAVHRVQHAKAGGANGVLDTFEPDPDGMARVRSIKFENAVPAVCDQAPTASADNPTPIAANTPVHLQVTAGGSEPRHFQWYRGALNDVSNPVGNDVPYYDTPALTQTTDFWVKVTNGCGTATAAIHVEVAACLAPTATPQNPSPVIENTSAHLAVTAGGTGPWHYQWYRGLVDDTSTEVGNDEPFYDTPVLSQPGADYWVKVTNECSTTSVKVPFHLEVVPCGTPFAIQAVPAVFIEGTAFQLRAPVATGATYRWYEGQPRTLLATTTVPVYDVSSGITAAARYAVEMQVGACTVTSSDLVIAPCLSRRAISSSRTSPGTYKLSIVDDQPGTTYQWYEGSNHQDLTKPRGTGPVIYVQPTGATVYWVRMTRVCSGVTITLDLDKPIDPAACLPTILVQPVSASHTSSVTTSVVAGGAGPFFYQWIEVLPEGKTKVIANAVGASYTWSAPIPSGRTGHHQVVYVEVREGKPTADATTSEHVTLAITDAPQHIDSSSGNVTLTSASQRALLFVTMEPAQAAGEHEYEYEWYMDDGTAEGFPIGHEFASISLPSSSAAYWVKVKGVHTRNTGDRHEEETVSPRMLVQLSTACDMLPLRVVQSLDRICLDEGSGANQSPLVTFRAYTETPDVTFQWYAGQAGDTRVPLESDQGKPNELTVGGNAVNKVWVRATRECGVYLDSSTLSFTRGDCAPLFINQTLAPVDVEWGGDTQVVFPPITAPNLVYHWYRQADVPGDPDVLVPGSGPTLVLTDLIQSGRYYVHVRNSACPNSGSTTFPTLVRISSATGLTPPNWVTEVWRDSDATSGVTLSGLTTGATRYEWFLGETLDPRNRVSDSTSPTFTTPNLTAETRYWVRVHGSGGRFIDSPTITVKICNPPKLTAEQEALLILNRYVLANQLVTFHNPIIAPATGSKHQSQWYRGVSPDTSQPLAETGPYLSVRQDVTTRYWFRVSTVCGVNGSDPRVYNSPTFTAHVCATPVITTQPTAVPSRVFTGGASVLNVAATVTTEGPLTYQWYVGAPGQTGSPVAGGTTATISVSPTADTTYWVRVTTGACSTDSAAVTVTMCTYAQSVTLPANVNIGYGETATLQFPSLNPPNQSKFITWYRGAAGDRTTPVQYVASASTLNYTTTPLTATTQYWMDFVHLGCLTTSTATTVTVCKPAITTQPVGTAIASGSPATLTVATTPIPGQTYQWYTGAAGNTSTPVAGATSASLTLSPTATTSYWVRVKGTCVPDAFVDSTAATVTVCNPPTITAVSAPQFIASGQQVAVSVTATGADLTYQWYVGASGTTTSPIVNATSSMHYVSPTVTTNYWCRVTSAGLCIANSATATVNVCNPPVITQQPSTSAQRIFPGGSATLSVTATAGGAMTYQWYAGAPGVTTAPVAGGTTPTITVSPTVDTTYWVRVTTSVCTKDSAAVTVTMCTYPSTISLPATRDVAYGESVVLGFPSLYPVESKYIRWYRGAAGDRTNLVAYHASLSSLNFTTPAMTATTQYWVEFEHLGCLTTSNATTVRVCKPTITTQPVSAMTIASGSPATLSVSTTAISGQTYQWYTGAAGNTSSPVAGGTNASLTVSPTTTTSYWVRVKGTCVPDAFADSTAATITVCNPPAITAVSPAQFIRSGQQTALSVTATGSDLTYQWYTGTSGNTASPIFNATSSMHYVSPTATTSYWCRVTSAGLCIANSATATVNVCNPPVITQQPTASVPRVFAGGSTTLSVTATAGGAMTYQWYAGAPGTTTSPVPGGTAATITVSPAADTTYWVRVTTSVCTTDSAAVTVTMCTYPSTISLPATRDVAYGESVVLGFPSLYPVESKYIRWYRGAAGDRTNLVAYHASLSSLNFTTPAMTATTQYWVEFEHLGCLTTSNATTVRVCKPTITTQPVSAMTIASGSPATLSVSTTAISGQTYQWYTGAVGNTSSPVAGGTNASLTVSPTVTTSYWVRVKGSCVPDAFVDSTAATITVCNPPAITAVSPNQSIRSGQQAVVSVTATGSDLTYQWYIGTSGTTTSPINGATSFMQYVSPTSTTSYWCRVTSSGLCAVNGATTTVNVCNPPVITQQAAASPQRIFPGGSTTLSVTATSGGTMTYQWYVGSPGTTSSPVAGGTARTITVSPAAATTYWVRVTTSVCTTDSAAVTVSMCSYVPTVTLPATRDIASGESVTLPFPTMSPLNEAKTIRWYRGAAGDRTNLVLSGSGTSLNYTTPILTATTSYWMEFDHLGCTTTSTATTVRVCKPTITAQPQNALITAGNAHTLSVAATGSPLTYQWYIGSTGDTSQPVAGATSASVTITPAVTTTYWVRVTGCTTTADSAAATVTVCTIPVVTSLTKAGGYAIGGTGSVTVTASGTSLTYQWYKGQSGDTSRPISGATADSYYFNLQVSEYYWVRVTSGCNNVSVNSAAILYSVVPKITVQPEDLVVPRGTSATLSVTATGTFLTYQWYRGSTGTIISGATSATYTTPALTTVPNEYFCVVKSGEHSVTTQHAFVTLCDGPTIISFTQTYNAGSTYRLSVLVHSSQFGQVTYHWYKGVPSDVAQSTYLGLLGNDEYFNVTTPTTYWVRVAFTDDGCFRDTAGKTLP